jgi:hypothetical protein
MAIAALESQREVREIAGLERLGWAVRWLDRDAAIATSLPFVVTGALAVEAPELLRSVLIERMRAGRHSLLVPRFRPGDLASVLDAPAAVEVLTGETTELTWQGEAFRVPGSVLFRTKLHANRWAVVDGRGAQVLAYQPTTARGRVVLCAASVTTARPGARADDQQRLLAALLQACIGEPEPEATPTMPPAAGPLSATELLATDADTGPGLLLALLSGAPRDDAKAIVEQARRMCGTQLEAEKVTALIGRLTTTPEEIEGALRQAGWTTFVRRCKRDIEQS